MVLLLLLVSLSIVCKKSHFWSNFFFIILQSNSKWNGSWALFFGSSNLGTTSHHHRVKNLQYSRFVSYKIISVRIFFAKKLAYFKNIVIFGIFFQHYFGFLSPQIHTTTSSRAQSSSKSTICRTNGTDMKTALVMRIVLSIVHWSVLSNPWTLKTFTNQFHKTFLFSVTDYVCFLFID